MIYSTLKPYIDKIMIQGRMESYWSSCRWEIMKYDTPFGWSAGEIGIKVEEQSFESQEMTRIIMSWKDLISYVYFYNWGV